jgi:putative pyruvate formate lyase activating enzyme
VPLTSSVLAGLIARGRGEGARNLNILGGEPGVNLPGVLELLAAVEPRLGMATGSDDGPWSAATGSACLPPLIWNSNFYCAPEVLEAVSGLVALYLPDLKFGCSFCAEALCGAADYWEVVTARLREVSQREPGRMLVRHLLLPGHFSCCTRPALAWLAREIPGVRVSLKRDYLVMPQARSDARLRRFLTPEEVDLAAGLATSLGLNYQLSGTTPCDLAAATACPHAAGNGQPAGSRPPQTLEIAISPQGQVFLRHPTRAAAAAVARACGGEATKEA